MSMESMTLDDLKSQLSDIQKRVERHRVEEESLLVIRGELWQMAYDNKLANQSELARLSGVTDMIVARVLKKRNQ